MTPPEEFAIRTQQQFEWLEQLIIPANRAEIMRHGFKTKLSDVLDPAAFARFLSEKGFKIIHMRRRNLLKLAVSEINANRLFQKTSLWNLTQECNRMEPIAVDIAGVIARMDWRQQVETYLKSYIDALACEKLELFYEDMLSHEQLFLSRVDSFLGVPYVHRSGDVLKNTPDDLRSCITNYDELVQSLVGTKYDSLVH